MEETIANHCLVDIWRELNPQLQRFTWRRTNPCQQSRLDFFFFLFSYIRVLEEELETKIRLIKKKVNKTELDLENLKAANENLVDIRQKKNGRCTAEIKS